LQEAGTTTTGPRSQFATTLVHLTTAAEEEVCGVANMTTDKHVQFQVHLLDAPTEATTKWCANMDLVANQLE
jgi:hypothetical protein